MCRYLYILTFSVLVVFSSPAAYAQADTTATDTTEVKVKKKDLAGHQLCLGVDIFHPIVNNFLKDRYSNEIQVDYYLHNEYYMVAEGGWGGSNVNYTDLKYTTTNNFFRFGFNKCVLTRDNPRDWDMMLMGLRVGVADINRSNTSYTITDSFWGNKPGSEKPITFEAYWVELTGGVRVELAKGLCAGWNARGKFLMNGRSFTLTAPLYIAGYGKGDKNTIFDFNMYISYAIRWKRKSLGVIDPKTGLPVPVKPVVAPDAKKEEKNETQDVK